MIGYIAGLFDGEGSPIFTITAKTSHGRRCLSIRHWITIGLSYDTGRETLERVAEFLNSIDIKASVYKPTSKHWVLRIASRESIIRFCDLVEDQLIIKADRIRVFKEIMSLLLNTPKASRWHPYTSEHYDFYRRLCKMWDDVRAKDQSMRKCKSGTQIFATLEEKFNHVWNTLYP